MLPPFAVRATPGLPTGPRVSWRELPNSAVYCTMRKEKRAKLDEEIKKIERARDGIVKALNVSADDLAKIEEKLAQESAVAAGQDSDSDE